MKGRKPLPTAYKRLIGNPGKRPLNDAEPAFPPGVGEPPDHLDEAARAEWTRIGVILTAAGVATLADRALLAVHCMAWSRLTRAERELAATGEVLASEKGGTYQNPWLAVSRRAAEMLAKTAAMLGLDPSSRSRIRCSPPVPEDDRALRFFGGHVRTRPQTQLDRQGRPQTDD